MAKPSKNRKTAVATKPAAARPTTKEVVRIGQVQPPVDGTSRIVEAAGSAVTTRRKDKTLVAVMEKAMADAINQSAKDGITDNDKIRERQLAAREKARDSYLAEQAAATAAAAKAEADAAARTAGDAAAKAAAHSKG